MSNEVYGLITAGCMTFTLFFLVALLYWAGLTITKWFWLVLLPAIIALALWTTKFAQLLWFIDR